MKKVRKNNERFHVSNIVIFATFFLFICLIARLCYICLVNYKVGDTTIAAFIKNRNTKEEVIIPERGIIYDTSGEVLANDVASYTLLAYLSDKRVDAKGNKEYVEDIDYTSTKLAEVLGVEKEEISKVLENGKANNKYQVEFGTIGKGITEITKEEIDNLNLQGIDFIRNIKRYYPNGDFASYLLGYTVNKEDKEGNNLITGELGIEEAFTQAETPIREFMFIQMEKDTSYIGMFMNMAGLEKPNTPADVPTYILIPSYILHELTVAFKIGVLLYIPFIIVDMVVASILMAMGMMMLPPSMISLPFKIMLFVLVDGWQMLVGTLVNSFNI